MAASETDLGRHQLFPHGLVWQISQNTSSPAAEAAAANAKAFGKFQHVSLG